MTLPLSLTGLLTDNGKNPLLVEPITQGLIHKTFHIQMGADQYLLQTINTNVFNNPIGLIRNHQKLHQHFLSQSNPFPHPLPCPLPFPNHDWIFVDEQQSSWRITTYIDKTYTRTSIESPAQAVALAHFFAKFTQHASNLSTDDWHIPIPRFHDLRHRYEQFQEAIRSDSSKRKQRCLSLIQELNQRAAYVRFYDALNEDPSFLVRMMHHDAKLSNVLIEASSDAWLCPVDLDTVMPGYFFSDLGDMIRSICNGSAQEDNPPEDVTFRSDLFESLLTGYAEGLRDSLTTKENEYLPLSGILMTYMQSLRFMNDHLNGDAYYRIDRTGQNLDRARNQFTLLKEMENYLQKTGRAWLLN